ncbi:MAG: gliding motility-associated C-terminal domain-containing protein [Spirochaetales bacterium]|nr:gliding motility-associated C-terminal domain-containing protein [Spirochaetales bacterium]
MKKNYKKHGLTAILLSTIIILGCATFEGPMDLEGMPPEVTWISPANQDGVKDYLDVKIKIPAYENLKIKAYNIIVADQRGNAIFSSGEDSKKSGNQNLSIPSSFIWKGVNKDGNAVPDGDYKYHIEISYGTTQTFTSPKFTVVVDNTPPSVEVSAAYPLFSPDGDGRLDTVRIFQRFSSAEEKWSGVIANTTGKTIKKFNWDGLARDFTWDGLDEQDKPSPDGEYSYKVGSTDRAGNKAKFSLSGIIVDTTKSPVSITRDLNVFSPNADGKKDTIKIVPKVANISTMMSWTVSIHDRTGVAVRIFSGETTLPDSLIFDGKNNDGLLLNDGFYKSHISVLYKNGSESNEVSQLFEIDNSAPIINVSTDYLLFSPDGDGKKDGIDINQSSSQEELWTASILDSKGTVVKSFSWKNHAFKFSWNGLDNNGKKAADGTYSYRIDCTDNAENTVSHELQGIRIDTRKPVINVSAMNTSASPNSDGISDIISFTLTTDIPEEIRIWHLKILDKKETLIKTFSSTEVNTSLPPRIDWNGLDERGIVMESEYTAQLAVEYSKGNEVSSKTKDSFLIDITGPQLSISTSPAVFSPDQDGTDDILEIKSSAKDASGIDSWIIKIIDPAGNTFKTYNGTGELKNVIKWDGLSNEKELVQSASDYDIQYIVKDKVGNISYASSKIAIDILVMKDGNNLKIIISSIYFVPNKADYLSLDTDKIAKNLATLDRLAVILKKYNLYKIQIEGHAVRVYWDNPAKMQTEQDEVLMPLSTERAEVIRDALVRRGIDAERLLTVGYGGSRPVVPNSDLTNRWKNRRVEFLLIKK